MGCCKSSTRNAAQDTQRNVAADRATIVSPREVSYEPPSSSAQSRLKSRIDITGIELPFQSIDSAKALHIPTLQRQTSEEIRLVWSRPHNRALPEYKPAFEAMCLESKWLTHTKLERFLRELSDEMKRDSDLMRKCNNPSYFDDVLRQMIAKAYPGCNPTIQSDILHGCNIFQAVKNLYNTLGWRQPYMTAAFRRLQLFENADTVMAKLSEICDRAPRCSSAKRQAFNILIAAACDKSKSSGKASIVVAADLDSKEGALIRFHECIEDYLDDHKERAFKSSFMEPARFYYHAIGDESGRDHVNVHGLNWHLVLLLATMGVQLPLLPELSDPHVMSVIDFWKGLTPEAWAHFSDFSNFGLDFEGITALRQSSFTFISRRVPGK